MSEAAESDLSEETDLGHDDAELILDGDEEGDGEGEGAEEGDPDAAAAAEARKKYEERGDLSTEEIRRRWDNSKIALAEERAKRRDLERRLDALESGRGRGDDDGDRRQRRAAPEEDIDPEVDPMGAMKQMRAKIAAYEQQTRLEEESEQQRRAREDGISRVEAALHEHETDFREDHPDYDAAAGHYAQARARELLSFGITTANVKTMLREEFAALAQTAMKARKNPAAVVYEMAKGRGYKPGAAPSEDPKKDTAKPTSRLKDLARGAKATSALQAGGGRGANGVDAETISRINIRSKAGRAQFEREFAKLEREAKAGGRR